jgi:hypothetical protein
VPKSLRAKVSKLRSPEEPKCRSVEAPKVSKIRSARGPEVPKAQSESGPSIGRDTQQQIIHFIFFPPKDFHTSHS